MHSHSRSVTDQLDFPNFAIRVVESDLRRTSRFLLTYLLAIESVLLRCKVVHRGAVFSITPAVSRMRAVPHNSCTRTFRETFRERVRYFSDTSERVNRHSVRVIIRTTRFRASRGKLLAEEIRREDHRSPLPFELDTMLGAAPRMPRDQNRN